MNKLNFIFGINIQGISREISHNIHHHKKVNPMKKFQMKKTTKFPYTEFQVPWKLIQPLWLLIFLTSFSFRAQAQIPDMTLRFANPHYICESQTYCVDVELQTDTPEQWVYGMNIRFFYDDHELEYVGISDLQPGYENQEPEIVTGPAGSGALWGFPGPIEWFNGKIQLVSLDNPVYISTSGWTKFCTVCFHVDNPNSLNIKNFCPSIVWDLKQRIPDKALLEDGDGFLPGDDGVVITVVKFIEDELTSPPTFEIVQQFNWMYTQGGNSYGYPVSEICLSTICGHIIPVADWAIYLAIGLMVVLSLVIYRRRIS